MRNVKSHHVNEKRLRDLTPTTFENLIFDLIRADAMENVAWRTPGVDGGRDIEGELLQRDFAGHTHRTKWLIECKRYKASVDWPTVWEKVAYADSGQADFLLLATTSKFSTRCLDEIEKWNSRDRKPAIRVWPRHEISFRLLMKPHIARKYGLIDSTPSAIDIADLALHLSRMTQSALAHIDSGKKSNTYLIAASAISHLLYVRTVDLNEVGKFRHSTLLLQENGLPSIGEVSVADLSQFDGAGILAYIHCVSVVEKEDFLLEKGENGELNIKFQKLIKPGLINIKLLQVIAFWSGITVSEKENCLCLSQQTVV